MENEKKACCKCSKVIGSGELSYHPIRGGYSPEHFPLFHFEKRPLCPDCLCRQKKIDVFEKVLAVIGLGIVLYFMVSGFIIMFSAR